MIGPRRLTLWSASALAVWLVAWFAWLSPAHNGRWIALVIAVAPLICVAWPLIRDRGAAYAWCGFIALGYMAHAVTEIFADAGDRYLAVVELALVAILFAAASAGYRTRQGRQQPDASRQ